MKLILKFCFCSLALVSTQSVAYSQVGTKKTLPFTAEENKDGARFVWLVCERANCRYEYVPAKELPVSPAFQKLKTGDAPEAGDIACWPTLVGVYGPAKSDEGELIFAEGRKPLRTIQGKLGAPTWIRFREDWLGPFRRQNRAKGELRFRKKTVDYVNPNAAVWKQSDGGAPADGSKAWVSFERRAIRDMNGVDVRPVISLVIERTPEVVKDSQTYFNNWKDRLTIRMKVDTVEQRGGSTVAHLSYEDSGVRHRVLVKYLVLGEIGLQAICDSTDTVFNNVSQDFLDWIDLVQFKE